MADETATTSEGFDTSKDEQTTQGITGTTPGASENAQNPAEEGQAAAAAPAEGESDQARSQEEPQTDDQVSPTPAQAEEGVQAPAESGQDAQEGRTGQAAQAGPSARTQPAAPEARPRSAAPKPAPTPAAFARKAPHVTPAPATPTYSKEDLAKAESFGRVDDQGNVFVKDQGSERQVGQFPDAKPGEALDLYARRYLDLNEKLTLFATRLKSANIKAREIDDSLKSLTKEVASPDVVGDIDSLRTRLEALKTEGAAKKEELTKERREAMAKAVKERTAIVEKAEDLVASLDETTNWRNTGDKFRSLFDQWQHHQRTTIRIDKADADALWKRFSTARSEFNQARRKWAQERDEEQGAAKRIKEEIISRANEIKDSTDWGATSHEFNELMDRWKLAGRAGRNEDDALWARFRAAADVFFNARQADRDQMSSDEKENLVKKEALLTKAEALVPVKDAKAAKQARQALAAIQEEWDQIGYVPRNDVRRIEGRLDAVDRQIKAVEDAAWTQSDPEADARKSSFEDQLKAQLADLDRQIASEQDPDKRSALQAEKATKEQWLNAVK
ncbi:DUF349 domain-containing protein [Bifidobacterium favimelis]|uniref:DUF349 domain-containing protein n=1 Tax=Bifidobacterium favimelis TaxID=3122979 RepID=A0ABU8ZPU5_9BIFI